MARDYILAFGDKKGLRERTDASIRSMAHWAGKGILWAAMMLAFFVVSTWLLVNWIGILFIALDVLGLSLLRGDGDLIYVAGVGWICVGAVMIWRTRKERQMRQERLNKWGMSEDDRRRVQKETAELLKRQDWRFTLRANGFTEEEIDQLESLTSPSK